MDNVKINEWLARLDRDIALVAKLNDLHSRSIYHQPLQCAYATHEDITALKQELTNRGF